MPGKLVEPTRQRGNNRDKCSSNETTKREELSRKKELLALWMMLAQEDPPEEHQHNPHKLILPQGRQINLHRQRDGQRISHPYPTPLRPELLLSRGLLSNPGCNVSYLPILNEIEPKLTIN